MHLIYKIRTIRHTVHEFIVREVAFIYFDMMIKEHGMDKVWMEIFAMPDHV